MSCHHGPFLPTPSIVKEDAGDDEPVLKLLVGVFWSGRRGADFGIVGWASQPFFVSSLRWHHWEDIISESPG